jgi:hypothetical protein
MRSFNSQKPIFFQNKKFKVNGSRYEKVDLVSFLPTEMVAEILGEEKNRRGFGLRWLSLRGRVKLEERVLVLANKSDVVWWWKRGA